MSAAALSLAAVAAVVAAARDGQLGPRTHMERAGAGPMQTPVQIARVKDALPLAKVKSRAAQPDVAALFALPATTRYLKQFNDGSNLHELPTEVLEDRFWHEIQTAELVHNFGSSGATANCGFDLTIPMGVNSTQFWNQWQLQALGLVPVDGANNVFTEWSETVLFGFPPFQNVSAPDMATATDRPFYAGLNMYRGSGGNPQCGKAAVVLSRTYLQNQILAAPVDTGFFQGACGNGQTSGVLGNTTCAKCNAWPAGNRTLGVPVFLQHLLKPYLNYYNESAPIAGADYPSYSLARLLIRLLSRKTYSPASGGGGEDTALPLNFLENTLGYFELNPAASITFPAGVKMMIGMYELLWGTTEGAMLQKWCILRGWPLVWAYNPDMSFFRCGPGPPLPGCVVPANLSVGVDTANVRLLDPSVLAAVSAGHNVSLSPSVVAKFTAAFAATNATATSRQQLDVMWNALWGDAEMFGALAVEPVYYNACASELCVGVTVQAQTCVCPPPP